MVKISISPWACVSQSVVPEITFIRTHWNSSSDSVVPEQEASVLPGKLLEISILGSIPDLHQKFWEGGPDICVLISPPGSSADSNLRTT